MFIVLLKFSDNKSQASAFMEGHDQWVRRGFEEGVFLLVGSLQPAWVDLLLLMANRGKRLSIE